MELDLSFLNKTDILPNENLIGFGRLSSRASDCNSWDCHDDCIYECGNCEEGDYDYNPNCFDCFHDCDDCDCDDCDYDCDCNCDYNCDCNCDCNCDYDCDCNCDYVF